MSTHISLKFWGVRGSHPVPGEATVRFGGNTACVELQANGQTLILDAGTGIIALGRDLAEKAHTTGRPVKAVLLLSHLHQDHTQGFPFFSPAYTPGNRLTVLGPGLEDGALEAALARSMEPPAFPVRLSEMGADKVISNLHGGDRLALTASGVARLKPGQAAPEKAVIIRTLHSYAHPGGVLIYRIDWAGISVVYATDTEGYVGTDRRLAAFARGASLLIHDAQYSEEHYRGQLPGFPAVQGFGHSTAEMACEMAQAAGVEQLVLYHHDPNYDDSTIAAIEERVQAHFPQVTAAFEGLEILLSERTGDTAFPASASVANAYGAAVSESEAYPAGAGQAVESAKAPEAVQPCERHAARQQAEVGQKTPANGATARRVQFVRSRAMLFGHERPSRRLA